MSPTPDMQEDLDLISVRPRLRPGSSVSSDGRRNVRNVSSPGSGLCSAMMPAPLRRPLASTRSEVPSSSSSNIGSFEPLIPQQQQREKLTLSERDRKIAILEEELKVAKRLVELENCEQEKDRFSKLVEVEKTNGSALHDFGRKLTDVFQQNSFKDDILIQIEKGRREEIENHGENLRSIACETSDDVIKQKVSDMLGRKKLRINTVESSSQIPVLPKNIKVAKSTTNEIFDSEEENEIDSDPLVTRIIKPSRREEKSLEASAITGSVFKDSMIGVDVMEQQFIWEKIQQERRDEEYRMRGLKDKELVQEQLEIFRQIQEQNMARKKEEELTLKLIAEMALTDQRQQMRVNSSMRGAESVLPPISSVLPPRSSAATGPGTGVGWSLVGKTSSNEKVASLKNAAALDQKIRGNTGQGEEFSIWKKGMLEREEDERRRQLKNWEDGQKVKIVRNEEAFQVEDSRGQNTNYHYPPNRPKEGAGAGRRELSTRRQSEGLSGVAGRRELGARRKSEGWQDAEKEQRRIAENQRRRIEAQEKEAIAKTKEVALAREWEIATRRKEARVESDKEVTQSKSKFLNQKSKQK